MGVGQIISMSCLASREQILEKESSRVLDESDAERSEWRAGFTMNVCLHGSKKSGKNVAKDLNPVHGFF